MTSFYDTLKTYDWDDVKQNIMDKSKNDAIAAINNPHRTLDDFMALISPAATPLLEDMAVEANRLTLERFGNTIQLYIPLYVSNYCTNFCVYCGFNHDNDIHRKMLTLEEVQAETDVITGWGFKHLLLVSGEAPAVTTVDYYEKVIRAVRDKFSQIALEVQPLDTDDYARLHEAGLSFVCVYQETYNEQQYPKYHPKGRKANYRYRLETPDRVCTAGVQKMGIGALLGLEDWRTDSFFTALEIPGKDLLALQVLDLSSPPAATRRGLHAERPDQRQADGATDMRLPFARPAGRNLRVHAGKPGVPGSRDAPRSHVHECRIKHGAGRVRRSPQGTGTICHQR